MSSLNIRHQVHEGDNRNMSRCRVAFQLGCDLAIAPKIQYDDVRLDSNDVLKYGVGVGVEHAQPGVGKMFAMGFKTRAVITSNTFGGGRVVGAIVSRLSAKRGLAVTVAWSSGSSDWL